MLDLSGFVSATDGELERLEQHHPLYDRYRETWELYDAIWTGRLSEKMQHRFLPRGRTEEEHLYALRLRLSQWTPESQILVRRVLNHVFQERPERYLGGQAPLKRFLERATLDGQGLDALMFQATNVALTFGMSFIVIDMQERPANLDAATREEENAAGLGLPYAVVATPLDVTDWDVNDREEPVYLKLVTHPSHLGPDGKRTSLTRYTEYTPEEWVRTDVLEQDGTKKMRRTSGRHGLGRIPVILEAYETIAPGIGRSYVELPARIDVDLYQTESDRAYDRYDKTHPLLVIKSEDDLDQVYGKNFVVKLRPGEDAGYAATDGRVFDAIEDHVKRRQKDIYRLGHVEPPAAKSRVESGFSRLVAQEDEGRLYVSVADSVERAETGVWELVSRWLTGPQEWQPHEKAFKGNIRYPDRFSVLSSDELAVVLKDLLELGAPEVVIQGIKNVLWAQVLGSVAPDVLVEASEATQNADIHYNVGQQIDIARVVSELHGAGHLSAQESKSALDRLGILK